jgi:hypothetical protein
MYILVVVVVVALLAIAAFVFRGSVRDVPENQRLAVYRSGAFRMLGGPGPVKTLPALDQVVLLSVDDVGAAVVEGQANFGGLDVPVRASAFFEAGEAVKIIGFDRDQASVVVKA